MAFVETRRWRRGAPAATALVSVAGDGPGGHYRVENLSAGGALLCGARPVAVGSPVHIELRLPRRLPVKVAGTVVRIHEPAGDDGVAFAVAFRHVRPDVEDTIQQAAVEALEEVRRSIPVVLVLAEPGGDRSALARDVEALGRCLVSVLTPLDALRWLEDPHTRVEAALVGLSFGRAPGAEILRFLADHFPEVRRILLVAADANAAAMEKVGAAGGAHAVLAAPCDGRTLEAALVARGQPQ